MAGWWNRNACGAFVRVGVPDLSDPDYSESDCNKTASTPGGVRTRDLRIRNPPLCPAELPGFLVWLVAVISQNQSCCQGQIGRPKTAFEIQKRDKILRTR